MFELQDNLTPIIRAVVEGDFLESIKTELKSYAPYFEEVKAGVPVKIISRRLLPYPLADQTSYLRWSVNSASKYKNKWWRVALPSQLEVCVELRELSHGPSEISSGFPVKVFLTPGSSIEDL